MRRRFMLGAITALALGGMLGAALDGTPRAGLLMQRTTAGGGAAPTGICAADGGAAATNYFARVWALPATLDGPIPISGTAGPTNHLKAVNDLICGLVTDTVWPTLDALYILATNTATGSNTAVANLNLVSSLYTLVPSASAPAFAADAGYTGVNASTTVYLDTQFNPSTAGGHYTANAAHMMAWSFTATQAGSGGGVAMGNFNGTQASHIIPYLSDGSAYCSLNAANYATVPVGTAAGSTTCTRINPTDLHLYRNGALIDSDFTTITAVIPNNTVYLLARHDAGGATTGAALQIGAASIGGSLDATSPPAVSSSGGNTGTGLVPRVCAYLTAVHGSC
jgi:hypothetical protein